MRGINDKTIATRNWVIDLINKVLKKNVKELTQEHLTNESFNGKPVYEKYYTITLNSTDGTTSTPSGIDNLEDIIAVSADGINVSGTNRAVIGNNYSRDLTKNSFEAYYSITNNTIAIYHVGTYYRGQRAIVSIKYTKTTD